MNRNRLARRTATAAAALISLGLVAAAPSANAAEGTTSLATVLTSGNQGFDKDTADYDVLTAAILAVLKAKPDSPVKVLTEGGTALTAFIPTDKAFMNLATALGGKKVTTEAAAFATVAGLGIPTVEKVLQYHVVPGKAIMAADALKANGAKLKSALPGKTIGVVVVETPASITLVDYNKKLPNPKVILSKVDINEGNMQIAHGIDAVLMPTK
ncbi:MAG: fasciclin domain-containing protein [Actinomycetota bacterium]|nr:fasciclin domain-containing protein [Actinomycetota bacterium]